MDMHKILSNMQAAEKGEYKPSKDESNEIKKILESFNEVAGEQKQQLDEIASVTMSGDSADEVAQLVKIMNGSGAPDAAPVDAKSTPCGSNDGPPDMPPKAAMVTPRMMDDIETREEPVEEESWDNEPDETYDDHHKMTKDLSGGLNRQKKSYPPTNGGDNPMALETSLAEELSARLKQKMSEKKDQDGDGDSDFADVQIARMVASGMSKEDAKKKVKDKEYNEDIDVAEDKKKKKGPCWKGYEMVGMKKKNGKEVPNCVPKEGVEETAKKKDKEVEEAKKKGLDGKACWDGYYHAGTKMKGGKRVDDCRPRKKPKESVEEDANALAEGIVDQIRNVVDSKSAQRIQFDNGDSLTVDMFTASALVNLYNAVNDSNKAKIENNLGKSKEMFTKMADFAMKQAGANEGVEEGATDTKAKMKQILSTFKPISRSEKVVKAFSYKPYRDTESIPVIITKDPKVDEESDYPYALYIKSDDSSEMGHYEYYDNLETAISDAKHEIKDKIDRPRDDNYIPGQQRLPFEENIFDKILPEDELEEAAPKNNFVAKHAQTSGAGAHKNKKDKTGRKAKHKGREMSMESAPVFERYVKPFLNKSPQQMVEFYDREALNIINRLSQERRLLADNGANTVIHETIIGKLREGLSALPEETLNEMRLRKN